MLRIENILTRVRAYKPCSRRQLYRYFAELGIQPVGKRQRPNLYAPDTVSKVLDHLFGPLPGRTQSPSPRLPSMNELRAEKAKARGAK